uniref:Putative polyprotein n=1 Tax=Tanacetum cinerariifolium TaxID=118510 RepID=A0A6L2JB23_TANCI|nr:putative polyprotein [Tanacetum cinerariifolium]
MHGRMGRNSQMKKSKEDPRGSEKICAYASGKFLTTQSTIDAEINACINTLEKLKIYYLDKQEVTLRTDCQAIISFYNKTNSNKSSRVRMHRRNEGISSSSALLSGGSSTVPQCLSEEYEDNLRRSHEYLKPLPRIFTKTIFTNEEPGALYRRYQLKANQSPIRMDKSDAWRSVAQDLELSAAKETVKAMRNLQAIIQCKTQIFFRKSTKDNHTQSETRKSLQQISTEIQQSKPLTKREVLNLVKEISEQAKLVQKESLRQTEDLNQKVQKVLGENYSSTEQVNPIQQLIAYFLLTGTTVDLGEIIYSDIVTKLTNKSRLKYVSYLRFISCVLAELLATMIAVNNQEKSVSALPFSGKKKKGKSQTTSFEVEPDSQPLLLTTTADVQALLLSDDEMIKDSDDDVLEARDEMDEDIHHTNEEETQSPSPNKEPPESSYAQETDESDSDSSCPKDKHEEATTSYADLNSKIKGFHDATYKFHKGTEAAFSMYEKILTQFSKQTGKDVKKILSSIKVIQDVVKEDFSLNRKASALRRDEYLATWAKEAKLLEMTKSELIKVVHEEAEKAGIDKKLLKVQKVVRSSRRYRMLSGKSSTKNILKRGNDRRNFEVYNSFKFDDFRVTELDELGLIIEKKKNKIIGELMISLGKRHTRLGKIYEELEIQSALPVPAPEQASSQL